MEENNKLIRNSTAEFLIFTSQDGSNSIEARYEDETIWLSQKLMGELFEVGTNTINYHLKTILKNYWQKSEKYVLVKENSIKKLQISMLQVWTTIKMQSLLAIFFLKCKINSILEFTDTQLYSKQEERGSCKTLAALKLGEKMKALFHYFLHKFFQIIKLKKK